MCLILSCDSRTPSAIVNTVKFVFGLQIYLYLVVYHDRRYQYTQNKEFSDLTKRKRGFVRWLHFGTAVEREEENFDVQHTASKASHRRLTRPIMSAAAKRPSSLPGWMDGRLKQATSVSYAAGYSDCICISSAMKMKAFMTSQTGSTAPGFDPATTGSGRARWTGNQLAGDDVTWCVGRHFSAHWTPNTHSDVMVFNDWPR